MAQRYSHCLAQHLPVLWNWSWKSVEIPTIDTRTLSLRSAFGILSVILLIWSHTSSKWHGAPMRLTASNIFMYSGPVSLLTLWYRVSSLTKYALYLSCTVFFLLRTNFLFSFRFLCYSVSLDLVRFIWKLWLILRWVLRSLFGCTFPFAYKIVLIHSIRRRHYQFYCRYNSVYFVFRWNSFAHSNLSKCIGTKVLLIEVVVGSLSCLHVFPFQFQYRFTQIDYQSRFETHLIANIVPGIKSILCKNRCVYKAIMWIHITY